MENIWLIQIAKTGFLGFLICIDSLLILYDALILSGKYNMSFLCTFKISQDHLELFFSKIRSLGGCNNNPSARQFCAAYKKLLVYNDIQDVIRGNCMSLKCVPILTVSSTNTGCYLSNSVNELNALYLKTEFLICNRLTSVIIIMCIYMIHLIYHYVVKKL